MLVRLRLQRSSTSMSIDIVDHRFIPREFENCSNNHAQNFRLPPCRHRSLPRNSDQAYLARGGSLHFHRCNCLVDLVRLLVHIPSYLLQLLFSPSPARLFFMSSSICLALQSLVGSSPDFHDQLRNVLSGEEYQRSVSNLQRDDLVWLVNYLSKVRRRVTLPHLRSSHRRFSVISIFRALFPRSADDNP